MSPCRYLKADLLDHKAVFALPLVQWDDEKKAMPTYVMATVGFVLFTLLLIWVAIRILDWAGDEKPDSNYQKPKEKWGTASKRGRRHWLSWHAALGRPGYFRPSKKRERAEA
jgi:hypothetical protein